jgi:hypothetical protein
MTSGNPWFFVYDPALCDYAKLLGSSGTDTAQAVQYVQAYFDMDTGFSSSEGGLLNVLGWRNADVRQAAHRALSHLTDLFLRSEQSMNGAANAYQQGAQAAEATIDATYPGVMRTSRHISPPTIPYPGISEVCNPATALSPPVVPDNFVNPLLPIQQAQAVLSPADHILQAIKHIIGFDPLELAIKRFEGDWEKYGQIANGWKNLAEFIADVNHNITQGLATLDTFWGGNAEDAAWKYFDGLSGSLATMADTFRALHEHYLLAAFTAYEAAQAIAAEVEAMVDEAIVSLIALGVSAAAVAQGGLDIPNDAVALLADGTAIALSGGEILANLTEVAAALTGIGSMIINAASGFSAPTSYPLPGQPYRFPPA